MEYETFKALKFVMLAVAFFGFCFWQLYSVDKDIKKREAKQVADAAKSANGSDAASETARAA